MKGILFTEENHTKVVKKIKTETRRVIRQDLKDGFWAQDFKTNVTSGFKLIGATDQQAIKRELPSLKPNYRPGEVLYMKEPTCEANFGEGFNVCYKYEPKTVLEPQDFEWENKLFMPASKARFFLRVKEVKVEKLWDITQQSIINEGIEKPANEDESKLPVILRVGFAMLWGSINKKPPYDWNSNPWVWAYTFELIEDPEELRDIFEAVDSHSSVWDWYNNKL